MDASTPDLPFGTAFTSNEWLDVPEGDQEIGEVPGAVRTWQNGLPPFPVAGDGHYCGTQEDFQQGGTVPDPPIALNVYGGPACCPTPPEPFVFFGCAELESGSWNVYTLIVNGATGVYAPSNGTFTLRYQLLNDPSWPGCNWYSTATMPLGIPEGPARWAIQEPFPGTGDFFVGYYVPTVGFGNNFRLPGWNALVAAVHVPVSAGAPAGYPPFVSLLPGLASVPGPFCPAQGAFMPSDLRVRWPAPAISVTFTPVAHDGPFEANGACRYRGIILWASRIPLVQLVPVFTPATLTFGPGGLITLAGSTPLGSPFSYTATAPAWDLSPVALNLVGGTFPLFGLPASVLLYTQSDLPP